MDVWSNKTLKSLLAPAGWVLLGVAVVLHTGIAVPTVPVVTFLYYTILTAGLLLAWRFHSSRIFLALLTVFLAQRALAFFSSGNIHDLGQGHVAFETVSLLLPLNFVLLSLSTESGFSWSSLAPQALVLLVESVCVAVLSRPAPLQAAAFDSHPWHHAASTISFSWFTWLAGAAAAATLLTRFILFRKPAESALFWALSASFLALHFGGTGKIPLAYFGAATLILALSIIENSYLLAYHDELTSLPSRRAFNDALQGLKTPYSIAMVDIDHFKRFNDTYGHDTGDEVLRLVAGRLARVRGGGTAYRCGGEEFAIVFPERTTNVVVCHLEELRAAIEATPFCLRAADRRRALRGPDRRSQPRRPRARTGHTIRKLVEPESSGPVSVTVSIGVASSRRETRDADLVVRAADKALYRAKAHGRNRIETSPPTRERLRSKTASIA